MEEDEFLPGDPGKNLNHPAGSEGGGKWDGSRRWIGEILGPETWHLLGSHSKCLSSVIFCYPWLN
jgi:hypothetical protein